MTRNTHHPVVLPVAILAPALIAALFALFRAEASPLQESANPLRASATVDTATPTQPSAAAPINPPTAPADAVVITTPKPPSEIPSPASQLTVPRQQALGMIESGNDDRAIGRAGEVSRYQIMPAVWKHYSDSRQYRDPDASLDVAQQHWAWLYDYFKKNARREPTDFDMYVLWNTRHGLYAAKGFQPSRLGAIIRDRAQRFSNLVENAARSKAAATTPAARS